MNTSLIKQDDRLKALALAVARNRVGPDEPVEDVLLREGVPQAEFSALLDDQVFQQYIKAYVADLEENGFSFKSKCRILAEDAAASVYEIVKDYEAPAAARIRGFEVLAEMANLNPKQAPQQQAASTGYQLVINLGPATQSETFSGVTINQTPSSSSSPLPVHISSSQTAPAFLEDADAYEDAA